MTESGAFDESRRMWRTGWRRFLFPALWLVYLAQTAHGVAKHSHGFAAVLGYAIILAFCACYLVALPAGWSGQHRRYWLLFIACFPLTGLEYLFARQDALVFFVYIAVLVVASGRAKISLAVLIVLSATTVAAPTIGGGKPDWGGGATLVLVAFAMYGFFIIVRANIELAEARAEVARLAAENERSRIARDLHDLLGHSLTTITVKAGLARRLADRDPQRAAIEIGEVEELTRRTLADVRAAVSGYRDVTLAGELASAREVLRAAGLSATLPGAIDVVDPAYADLFGWVVREGVTNIVRHARAESATIRLGRDWIEILDDGRGGVGGAGNGLTGLRERVAAAGGTVTARGDQLGWRIHVTMAPVSEEVVPA